MPRIASFAVTPDGRRVVAMSDGALYTEDASVRAGRFWRSVTLEGLPEDARIVDLQVDGSHKAVALLADGSLWELPRTQFEVPRWREVTREGLP